MTSKPNVYLQQWSLRHMHANACVVGDTLCSPPMSGFTVSTLTRPSLPSPACAMVESTHLLVVVMDRANHSDCWFVAA